MVVKKHVRSSAIAGKNFQKKESSSEEPISSAADASYNTSFPLSHSEYNAPAAQKLL